jgi:hypothetical protein
MNTDLVLVNTISDRKAKYCRYVDTKRWDDLSELLVEKPRLRFYDPQGALLSGFDTTEEWIATMKDYLDGAHTIHQVHNGEIEVVSDQEVRAIWSMEDYLILAAGPDRPASMHGYGHYHETWILADGVWRIAAIELQRTILHFEPRA